MKIRQLAKAALALAALTLVSACVVEPAPAYYPSPPASYYYTPGPVYYAAPPAYGSVGVIYSNGHHRHWH